MTKLPPINRKPDWLKIRPNFGQKYISVKNLLSELRLHTVCQEATCPNIGECFSAGTATFLILGDRCTRNCGFCDVESGEPPPLDCDEPERVAEAVKALGLKFAVITSVTRDDLPDGGASIFAAVVESIRRVSPNCGVEVLIPDFAGDKGALKIVLDANPTVIAHNIETVPELYDTVRPQANYLRSLEVLKFCANNGNGIVVKSGIMIGLGESMRQIENTIKDAARAGCQVFTIGQYLSPSATHLQVKKFYHPEEFRMLAKYGISCGIAHVESGPLVRSSYLAHKQYAKFASASI